MNSELRCVLCVALLCTSTSMSAAVAADRVSPSDSTDTKISVVPEPTDSPRYLHDEHQTTQASMMIGGHSMGYQADLPNPPAALEALLREVENFALTAYSGALAAGSNPARE